MGIFDRLGQAANDMVGRINHSIETGDFSYLSYDLGQELSDMERDLADQALDAGRRAADAGRRTADAAKRTADAAKNSFRSKFHVQDKETETAFTKKDTIASENSGREAFYLLIMVMCIMFALGFAGAAFGKNLLYLIGTAVSAAVFFAFVKPLKKAVNITRLHKVFLKYKDIVGRDEYITIDELMIRTRESREQVLSDIRDLMSNGFLPGAVLDEDETVLILSENAYRYYVNYEREHASEKAAKKAEEAEEAAASENLSEEAKKVIEQGEQYIEDFHHLNEIIPDQSMSEKLDKLENITKRIFSAVKKKPETAPHLRKLLDYYLPTTKKLVQTYASAQNQPDTENISQMKSEIESSLDLINAACEKILDQMFMDDAWDVSSDVDVMKQMMKQDGLVDDDK
ncbi:MAG: hypothetical protein FRC54_06870 [bacterium LCO1.1]|uniref:5-bromo-4-chloroindolyl phosphate hydrolysis protein n=1 Tax=Candidatus Weimeria bifida TaxID=2599074 RepID=A0A6N7IZ59_9FIRM|nr:hypothetical protein [Candidatus Weimeria bifida]